MPGTVAQFTTTTRTHHRSVVAVTGEIDILTAPGLHAHLCDAVDANAGDVVRVDLSEVTFMGANGLTALARAETHAHTAGARLQLTAVPAHITRLLAITGLDQHFDLRRARRRARWRHHGTPRWSTPQPAPARSGASASRM